MRMRKKKWAQPYLDAHPEYALQNAEEYKGKWKQVLGCTVLHVEIGIGKGDYLNSMAAMYPDEGWVGIEKEHNVAAIACRKALELETMHRQRMIVADGIDLEQWFAPGEIDVIHLNFSDPWPKKYTHKRRLSSERFLNLYRSLLAGGGRILMKTDNQGLFTDSVDCFRSHGFTITEYSENWRGQPHPEDAVTEYESRFIALGQPIYRLCAVPERNAADAQVC